MSWRVGLTLAASCLLVGLGAAGWIAWRASVARDHLLAARAAVGQVERSLRAGDVAAARRSLETVQYEAHAATATTSGLLWWTTSHVPYAGRTPATVRVLARDVDEMAQQVLPDVLAAGDVLRDNGGGVDALHLPVQALADASAPLTRADKRLTVIRADLESLPHSGVLGPVARAREEVTRKVVTLAGQVSRGALVSRLAPDMLGLDGRRRYLLAFQNNAEARGTGGLVGVWGVLVADRGRVRLSRVFSVDQLPAVQPDLSMLGTDFRTLYGADPALWSNANESPHFPYAARLWLSMWQLSSDEALDGVVATDPVALSYLLSAAGPVELSDGTRVTAANVVDLTERVAYIRHPSRPDRKDWLAGLAEAVFTAISRRDLPAHEVLDALSRAAGEQRLLLYSAHRSEQAELAQTALAGSLPTGAAPFVSAVVNNAAGNKLDYYLRRQLHYDLGACHEGVRPSTVTLQLTNAIPTRPLPSYVTIRADTRRPVPVGSNRLLVHLYLTRGAGLRTAEVDGRVVAVGLGAELGHPVIAMTLALAPGQTREIRLELEEPAVPGKPVVRVQPLAVPQQTKVEARPCESI